jgi:hypothetical protein
MRCGQEGGEKHQVRPLLLANARAQARRLMAAAEKAPPMRSGPRSQGTPRKEGRGEAGMYLDERETPTLAGGTCP